MDFKTVQVDDKPRRFYLNGRHVSKAAYEEAEGKCFLFDSFKTEVKATKQGDKVTQYKSGRGYFAP